LRGLRDRDPAARLAAVTALAQMGDQQALKPLAGLARDRTRLGARQINREAAAAARAIKDRRRQNAS
jgi:HEAT repeat protein